MPKRAVDSFILHIQFLSTHTMGFLVRCVRIKWWALPIHHICMGKMPINPYGAEQWLCDSKTEFVQTQLSISCYENFRVNEVKNVLIPVQKCIGYQRWNAIYMYILSVHRMADHNILSNGVFVGNLQNIYCN